MYPYLGPKLRLAGLMKHGAVNVPSHFPKKLSAVARPKLYPRNVLLGYSPPSSQAYGASGCQQNNIRHRISNLTISDIEECKERYESNDDSTSHLRAGRDRPCNGLGQLSESTCRNANEHNDSPINEPYKEETEENAEEPHARHHNRESERVRYPCNLQVIRRVDVDPGRACTIPLVVIDRSIG